MQLPELFRMGVVRPMDALAAAQLASYHISVPVRVEYIPIEDVYFDQIWDAGIFQRINEACQSNIDHYEEEELGFVQMPAAIKALSGPEIMSDQVKIFVDALHGMMEEAIKSRQSIYFIL